MLSVLPILWTLLDTTLSPANVGGGGGGGMLSHAIMHSWTPYRHFLNHAHVSVKVDAGVGLFPGYSQSRPADILVQNWILDGPCP